MRLEDSPWLQAGKVSSPRVRLFCFPYAGAGAAMYARWQRWMPAHVQVCGIDAPGRLTRRREPALRTMSTFIDALDREVSRWLDVPYALFGYSLGALHAFEWARRRRDLGGPDPIQLMVAARAAPQAPRRLPRLSDLPRQQFLREIQARYGALDPVVLAEPDLLDSTLQIIRDDMAMFDAYEYRQAPPLECPMLALGGSLDATVSRAELQMWSTETVSSFEARVLSGGHFFIREHGEAIARLVSERLQGQGFAYAR